MTCEVSEKSVMGRNRRRKINFIIGLAAGAFADGYLCLISGDEGNLLIHSVVFLGVALIVTGVVYRLFYLLGVIFLKEKG